MPQVVDAPLARRGQAPKYATIGARRMPLTNGDRLAVLAGEKTEVRHLHPASWKTASMRRVRDPGPCVVYTERADGLVVTSVIWAEKVWYEPLSSISPESIRAEGYETYEEWMAYMKRRIGKKVRPMIEVRVTPVRRLTEGDVEAFKARTYDRLYGQYA